MAGELSTQILSMLSMRRYNRAKPFMVSELRKRVSLAVARNSPIPLVGFWGIGTKKVADESERLAFDLLKSMCHEVKLIYPPAMDFLFLLSTMHAVHNGIDKDCIRRYSQSVKEKHADHQFRFMELEILWEKYGISFERIESEIRSQPESWWREVPNAGELEERAAKNNGRLPPRPAAQFYVIMRRLERAMLETEFPDAVFHTYSPASDRHFMPDMPTLHLYSTRRGWSHAPWLATQSPRVHEARVVTRRCERPQSLPNDHGIY